VASALSGRRLPHHLPLGRLAKSPPARRMNRSALSFDRQLFLSRGRCLCKRRRRVRSANHLCQQLFQRGSARVNSRTPLWSMRAGAVSLLLRQPMSCRWTSPSQSRISRMRRPRLDQTTRLEIPRPTKAPLADRCLHQGACLVFSNERDRTPRRNLQAPQLTCSGPGVSSKSRPPPSNTSPATRTATCSPPPFATKTLPTTVKSSSNHSTSTPSDLPSSKATELRFKRPAHFPAATLVHRVYGCRYPRI